jgi:hypothetical protein
MAFTGMDDNDPWSSCIESWGYGGGAVPVPFTGRVNGPDAPARCAEERWKL